MFQHAPKKARSLAQHEQMITTGGFSNAGALGFFVCEVDIHFFFEHI